MEPEAKALMRNMAAVWNYLTNRTLSVCSLKPFNGLRRMHKVGHVYESFGVKPAFFLENIMSAGWYMLEIQSKLPLVQVSMQVYLNNNCAVGHLERFRFTLLPGRCCKRLIHLSADGRLHLELDMAPGIFELQHFRLVRVSKRFAQSRMLRKLEALHPYYKRTAEHASLKHECGPKNTGDLRIFWRHYCALFEDPANIVSYSEWIRQFDAVNYDMRDAMEANSAKFVYKPLVSIIMCVNNPNPAWLEEAIESVRRQVYSNWELLLNVGELTRSETDKSLSRYAELDKRIKLTLSQKNDYMFQESHGVLDLLSGEWVAILKQDDVLADSALYWIVDAINSCPESRLIYSDEDKIDEQGRRSDPYFKCDWNTDLFYSQNMFSRLGVYEAALVRDVGGFRTGFEGAEDYDLALRCLERIAPWQIRHVPRILYHWRKSPNSTAVSLAANPYSVAGERALNEHFERQGVNARAETVGYGFRVHYTLPDRLPLVSLIIPTRNGLKLLRQCVESILEKTTYANYEILIVDNGSDDPETLAYLNELASVPRILVLRDDRPFNYSALNNAAVKLARGEIVGLINNDIEVISKDWLSEMVSHSLRPEVGAVGARLWYADDTLQHAGVVLGLEGFAGHVHRYLSRDGHGYCSRAVLIQSFSAVTGACLVVRKAIYEALGGLNEVELQVACNDVDFCLRVREAGYRNIWTPYAELYHHESSTRGFDDTPEKIARAEKEVAYMHQRWAHALRNDPAYSPNLSLDICDFSLAWPPRVDAVISDFFETAAA